MLELDNKIFLQKSLGMVKITMPKSKTIFIPTCPYLRLQQLNWSKKGHLRDLVLELDQHTWI